MGNNKKLEIIKFDLANGKSHWKQALEQIQEKLVWIWNNREFEATYSFIIVQGNMYYGKIYYKLFWTFWLTNSWNFPVTLPLNRTNVPPRLASTFAELWVKASILYSKYTIDFEMRWENGCSVALNPYTLIMPIAKMSIIKNYICTILYPFKLLIIFQANVRLGFDSIQQILIDCSSMATKLHF